MEEKKSPDPQAEGKVLNMELLRKKLVKNLIQKSLKIKGIDF